MTLWRRRLRLAAALLAGFGGVLLPLLATVLAEDTLVTTMVVWMPPRLLWLGAFAAAVVVATCASGLWRLSALLPVLAMVALLLPSASYFDSGVRGLRVGSWNLAKGTLAGVDHRALVDGLVTIDADVVCVSEAGAWDWLPHFRVDDIARAAGYSVVVGSGEVRLLSRLPVSHVVEVPLPPGPAARPMVVASVRKETHAGGRDFRVGCVHLMPRLMWIADSIDRGEARHGSWSVIAAAARAQGRTLLTALRTDNGANNGDDHGDLDPVVDVVAGDWNNQAFGHIVGDVIDAGYADPFAGKDVNTFGDGLLAKRIDHIVVTQTLSVSSSSTLLLSGSDHAALVVEIGPRRGR
jgi:endonuclease/exonuclease/phosphatase (EEP) superfamily protein YafD